jgi:enoyl-CoA hydratase/carnithine racemase
VGVADGKAAFELTMTGRAVTPEEALRMGLINRIVSADGLMEEALELGATFAGYSPEALAEMKKILYAVADIPVADGIAYVDGALSH